MAKDIAIIDNIPLQILMDDPYPTYAILQERASVVWLESAQINLVTRFEDIKEVERNPAIFAATNLQSLQVKVMGHSLMRKDFSDHKFERQAIEPSFRPGTVKQHWMPIFSTITDELISSLASNGSAELFDDFALPLASRALAEICGFKDVAWRDLASWSQSLMDGVGNYGADPQISARAKEASDAIDLAIEDVLDFHTATLNPSVISSMLHADPKQTIAQIRANIKVIVGGGLNEPRDSILTAILGLLLNGHQKNRVIEEKVHWDSVFEEAVRWVAPIGMYPRKVTQDVVLGDTQVRAGDELGLCVGAANRQKGRFDEPDTFNVFRKKQPHLAFGAGSHFCAGAWIARMMVGKIAVPMIFERLKNLEIPPGGQPEIRGWVFRGPVSLPVQWEV